MTWRTEIRQSVPAGSTRRLRAIVFDEDGARLPAAALEALTLTLTDVTTSAIVNGCNHRDVLGVNGGEVSAEGRLTLWLSPSDTALVTPEAEEEDRLAVLAWAYGGGKVGLHEVAFTVVGLG